MDDVDLVPDDGSGGIPVSVVVTPLEGRRRQIQASITIPTTVEAIWRILTDYDRLAECIPNLVESCVVGEEDGCKIVRQVGTQQFLMLKFAATVTVKIQERYLEQVAFTMVEGDFVEFTGSWDLVPVPEGTRLTYHLTILPPRHMPIKIVEGRLCQDLTVNLQAIHNQALSQ
ncbi:MAG: SRPBCC family protein [Synechococcales cyanobacterium]